MRGWMIASAALSFGLAPYQCKSDTPPPAHEDTPGDALWLLCGRLAHKGDLDGARATLDFLIERYPSSRDAVRAKEEREKPLPCGDVAIGAAAASSSVSAIGAAKAP